MQRSGAPENPIRMKFLLLTVVMLRTVRLYCSSPNRPWPWIWSPGEACQLARREVRSSGLKVDNLLRTVRTVARLSCSSYNLIAPRMKMDNLEGSLRPVHYY